MNHHPSCKPDDNNLIYKCHQCGREESAINVLEDLQKNTERSMALLRIELKDWKDRAYEASGIIAGERRRADAAEEEVRQLKANQPVPHLTGTIKVYLLDVIEQGIDVTDPEEWPGFNANLRTAQALLKGQLTEVPKDIQEQLKQLGKLRGM